MPKPGWAVALAVCAAILAVAAGALELANARSTSRPTYRGTAIPPGIHLPTFTLRNQHGDVVRSTALRGRVVVMTFLDTKCKTSCPFIAGRIGMAFRQMNAEQRQGVTTLALSMNPKDDTPARARVFLNREHAARVVQYLTGTEPQLRPVWRALHVLSTLDSGNTNTHSSSVRIYDRAGEWVSD